MATLSCKYQASVASFYLMPYTATGRVESVSDSLSRQGNAIREEGFFVGKGEGAGSTSRSGFLKGTSNRTFFSCTVYSNILEGILI